MQNLMTNGRVSEGEIMDIIFDACRANAKRNNEMIRNHFVIFASMGQEQHIASVLDKKRNLVGSAIVDQHDC